MRTVTVNGNVVNWKNWRFHASVRAREGLVISALSYVDADQVRAHPQSCQYFRNGGALR